MKTLKLIIGFLIGMSALQIVNAQGYYRRDYYDRHDNHRDRYDKREHTDRNYRYDRLTIEMLEYKIERASRHGELTGKELRKLENELYDLKQLERRVYRNHRVTYRERMRLEEEKRDLERRIDKYINNCRHR